MATIIQTPLVNSIGQCVYAERYWDEMEDMKYYLCLGDTFISQKATCVEVTEQFFNAFNKEFKDTDCRAETK